MALLITYDSSFKVVENMPICHQVLLK